MRAYAVGGGTAQEVGGNSIIANKKYKREALKEKKSLNQYV